MRDLFSLLLVGIAASSVLFSSRDADGAQFARDVLPILSKRCFSCHGPDQSESGLAFDSRERALAETDSDEPAIVPGDAAASEAIRRITTTEDFERMPPEGEPLPDAEIATLREWIDSGAKYEKHWAFTPLGRPEPPSVDDADWVRNPIDRFVLARLESSGLKPSAEADRRTLARRLYYDLIGLPPAPERVAAFVADDRSDAYERLVEELLASPHHGEKWARHWLDVVRYGETNSFERDAAKPFVWKYRDYVIRSFNEDKPYDQFVREQIAGDELDELTIDGITATGFYRLGVWDDEPADKLQAKHDELDDIVSTTSQAFLGLTVGCARCHDHKIDPIPQADYYGLVAFFADVTPYALSDRRDAKHHSLWDVSGPLQTQRRSKLEAQKETLRAEKAEIEAAVIPKLDAEDQRRTETHERQSVFDEKLSLYVEPLVLGRYRDLVQRIKAADERLDRLPPPELLLSVAKCDPDPGATHVMMRGNPHSPGEEVEPHFPALFEDADPSLPVVADDARSAGRRRLLADWIASPENRLTSRVIANRVWQHHFGRGIVRSASNFGRLGTPPTHPELLDWLARWLVQHEWRLKPLHRLIVTSSAYRMGSTPDPAAAEVDPANDLFWRFDMRRLTAEEVRDTALSVSGSLNGELYGPSVYPRLSDEVLHTQSRPGEGWDTSDEAAVEARRRSVYIHIKRSLIPPVLANFDFPDTDTSCEARFNTVQPAQALSMLHGQFFQEQAAALATRVNAEDDEGVKARVERALSLVLQREADEATVSDGLRLINRYQSIHGLSEDEAFKRFCLMAMNLNEFVFLD